MAHAFALMPEKAGTGAAAPWVYLPAWLRPAIPETPSSGRKPQSRTAETNRAASAPFPIFPEIPPDRETSGQTKSPSARVRRAAHVFINE